MLTERSHVRRPVAPVVKSLVRNIDRRWFKALVAWFGNTFEDSSMLDQFFIDGSDTLWVRPKDSDRVYWWDEIGKTWIGGAMSKAVG
jgi:hypothetical protein